LKRTHNRPLKAFISYSKFDGDYNKHGINYLREFKAHLSPLTDHNQLLVLWDDTDLYAAEDYDPKIKEELLSCDLVFFLISPDLLRTKYIREKEFPVAVDRAGSNECHIVPIIIRACGWRDIDLLNKHTALPQKKDPIGSCNDRDKAWQEVYKGVKRLVLKIIDEQTIPSTELKDITGQTPLPHTTLDRSIEIARLAKPSIRITQHTVTYLNRLLHNYNTVSVISELGKNRLQLENIFISPLLYRTEEFKAFRNDLRKRSNSLERRTEAKTITRPLGDFISEGIKKIILLGNPGQGKSTLANWVTTALACKLLKGKCSHNVPNAYEFKDHELLPIILNCKKPISFDANDQLSYFIRRAVEQLAFEGNEKKALIDQLTKIVKEGNVMFIIDGIEEIKDEAQRKNICAAFTTLSDNLPQHYFLFTCRIFAYSNVQNLVGDDFIHLRMAEYDQSKKEEFIHTISKYLEFSAQDKAKLLKKMQDPLIEPITRTPLNLTNLCAIYHDEKKFPAGLKQLYLGSIRLLFERISPHKVQIFLDDRLLKELSWLAYKITKDNANEFTREIFIEIIEHYREKYPEQGHHAPSPNRMFDYLIEKVGLFDALTSGKGRSSATTVCKFFHESYREYLAGYFICLKLDRLLPGGNNIAGNIDKMAAAFDLVRKNSADKEGKYYTIKGAWFTIVNYAFSSCIESEKIKTIELLTTNKKGKFSSQRQLARLVMAGHCISNNYSVKLKESCRKIVLDLCGMTSGKDFSKNLNPVTEIDKVFYRLFDSPWKDYVLDSILQYYLSLENIDDDGLYKLSLFYLGRTEEISRNKITSNKYWDLNLSTTDDIHLLKYCYHSLNIGYLWDHQDQKFTKFETHLPKIIANLFRILTSEKENLTAAAAFSLLWLNKAPSREPGIWQPSKNELAVVTDLYMRLTCPEICRRLLHIITMQLDSNWLYEGNLFYDLGQQLDLGIVPENYNFKPGADRFSLKARQLMSLSRGSKTKLTLAVFVCRTGLKDPEVLNILMDNWEDLRSDTKLSIVAPYFVYYDESRVLDWAIRNLLTGKNENDSFLGLLLFFAMNRRGRMIDPINLSALLRPGNMKNAEKFIKDNITTIRDFIKNGKIKSNNFSFRSKATKLYNLKEISGYDSTGRKAWYFVLVRPEKLNAFYRILETKAMNIDDFGETIESHYGEEKPPQLKARMKEKYNIDVWDDL